MRCALFTLFIVLLAGFAQAEPLQDSSLSELEQRLDDIDARLDHLARNTLRSGVGSIGHRSGDHQQPNALEWVQIDLKQAEPIDQIVLVPSIWRDTKSGFDADNFPVAFKIVAGIRPDTEGTVIASFSASDQLLPRIAPLIIPCATTASWVRLEATQLSPRAFDGDYSLDLAEILIFNGQKNLALNQPVTTSSRILDKRPGRAPRGLVDGFVPYLMDAAQGTQSLAFFKHYDSTIQPILKIDLGTLRTVTGVHLHSIDISDTIPQRFPSDFAMPRHLLIEGASQPDYSDAQVLIDHRIRSVFDTGPILMLNSPEIECRYLRLTALEPYIDTTYSGTPDSEILHGRIGFAEIEILSDGKNVAQGHLFSADLELAPNRPLSALTDGRNLYGNILSPREWLNQLAERHELETERPLVAAELKRRYARQKSTVRIMRWLFALVAAGIIIAVLIERNIRQRAIYRTRQHIAADLHDELGANLHAIGMLGDLVEKAQSTPERLKKLLQRMREITDRTGRAARFCANMLEDEQRYVDVADNMRRTADRLTADLEHELSFEGESLLAQLSARKRIDLFLFYKESLANIIRHSGATHVTTRLAITPRKLELIITDNGSGLNGDIPPSLKRRARLLGGQVSTCPHTPSGTQIILQLRFKRRLRPSPISES